MADSPCSFLPQIPHDASRLIEDTIAVLFENDPARFLKTHYVPVHGTNQSLITFEFDAVMFDAEFRSALRARGFELPERDISVSGHLSPS
jgi:hypothetical protein